jgi:hypothetical protein
MTKKITKKTTATHRAEIAKRMHIAAMGDGFHILEIPAADGAPFEAWPGPFKSKRAAELFLDELLDAYAEGNPNEACCSNGIFAVFEQRARVVEFLEGQNGVANPRELACELIRHQPWNGFHGCHDGEIPF